MVSSVWLLAEAAPKDKNETTTQQCNNDAWFKYPKNEGIYQAGQDIYTRIDLANYQDIEKIDLLMKNKFIRSESTYPYEWGKPNEYPDSAIRNIGPGEYLLRARVIDKCGGTNTIDVGFQVVGNVANDNQLSGGNKQICNSNAWFKYPKNGGTYKAGDTIYVRVDSQKYQDIERIGLRVNGKNIGTDETYPYEWGKGDDTTDDELRNMDVGTYNLTAEIKGKCGNKNAIEMTFSVQ